MKKQVFGILTTVFLSSFSMSATCQAADTTAEELSRTEKAIVPIASFTASGNIPRLKASLHQGLDDGLTINEIKETLVHIYAYAGFPRALNAINAFSTVVDERKAQGKIDEIGKEAKPLPADFDQNAYGNKVRNTLVGRDISNRTSGYPVFTPIIDKFLVEHLFADIFVRDILSHQQRELVTISVLSSLPGAEPQLKGHLGIAMRMGYSEAQLKDFIEVLRERVGSFVAENSAQVLGTVLNTTLTKTPKAVEITKTTAPVKASSDYFTGNATISSRFKSQSSGNYAGGIVNFEKGARTAWHKHPAGQTLIVISGRGLVQSEGEDIQEMLPGDVVWIPANERHWHGAAPDTAMSHVAISEPYNDATVTWMEHVNDEQYAE